MPDVIVVGGGVIGLSIAWELAGNGLDVRILEQGAFGQEASWAGAGMLPPGNLVFAKTSEARLRGRAHQLWPDWSASLTSSTGIDNGYIRCGGVEVRLNDSTSARSHLENEVEAFRSEGIIVETDDIDDLRYRIPALGPDIVSAFLLPEFCQVRNPRHLKALQVGCTSRSVELIAGAPVRRIETVGTRIDSIQAGGEWHRAAEFVIAGGAWSNDLLAQVGVHLRIEPLRGQIVLLQSNPLPFREVIQAGREYLVPRNDGRILVGSTEEHAGFDKRNTAQGVNDLMQFALRVVPKLKEAQFERCWAGLRPYSSLGGPFIGRLPQFVNASVATGHFRHGLNLSPVTARLIRQILLNQPVDLIEECKIVG